MSKEHNHEADEKLDLDVQHVVAEAITKASEAGSLVGQEAPVYKCHTFLPTGGGDSYAKAITNQLNHLAPALGVLGFQVTYKEDSLSPLATKPDRGYFQIRVFASEPAA
jgi:hypothetical protein